MKRKLFNPKERAMVYSSRYLVIKHDAKSETLYFKWRGFLNSEIIQHEGENALEAIDGINASKIYNDSSSVSGTFDDISKWIATTWFDEVFSQRHFFFAWLLPQDYETKLSAENSLPKNSFVKAFTNGREAMAWLDNCSISG